MEKKLPKVFAGTIDHKIDNNKQVFYSSVENSDNFSTSKPVKTVNKTIEQKIADIFNSRSYVYKADVQIELETGVITKRIVGKNGRYLITIDNEKIPIKDIKDIWI